MNKLVQATSEIAATEVRSPDVVACLSCCGNGFRDVWVIDGWSVTDCLCTYGWTIDRSGTWHQPKSQGDRTQGDIGKREIPE